MDLRARILGEPHQDRLVLHGLVEGCFSGRGRGVAGSACSGGMVREAEGREQEVSWPQVFLPFFPITWPDPGWPLPLTSQWLHSSLLPREVNVSFPVLPAEPQDKAGGEQGLSPS